MPPREYKGSAATAFGHRSLPVAAGGAISPDADNDFPQGVAKTVQVTDVSAGQYLRYLPAGNEDDEWCEVVGAQVGFVPACTVRRVHPDTTCVVCAIFD